MPRKRKDDSNGIGHNEPPEEHRGTIDRDAAANYIDRILQLEEDAGSIRRAIRSVYDEAKEAGFIKTALRIIVKEKLETDDQRATREAIEAEADRLRVALGMLRGTPLGEAAEQRVVPLRAPRTDEPPSAA